MNKTENKKTVTKIYFNKSPKFEIHYQVRPISFLNPFEPKIQHSFFSSPYFTFDQSFF